MTLSLEIVTPGGIAWSRGGLDRVVLRRRERRFELGSEIVVLPRHGEMLVRLPDFTLRAGAGRDETAIEVHGGFAEVRRDRVTVLTPACGPPEQCAATADRG